ncbi:adenine-specific DNA-methyltransferase [Lachnospiraceae bacterium PF1-21]|uniref:site-specific DNA-methyltransferase (adenine-specific) n=1 Tax=Ohessyouella blattaphilus TaxID=2949333 RepID=A0ABT1EJL3_9FIRM|nr:N-6 DNA methylase [Ohessyouella blattaphilus]MCP1110878.1 Eco57I restriction-modification methylase domain-containing protein [Ohessyouella blattaphilus]MCR8564272.1 Eco57I restriction-modification methylase domain-containing protein [Ohessyouella blattaphilus]
MEDKLSGSYYTPYETVDFMYEYLLERNKLSQRVLEPSVGDGRFIERISNNVTVNEVVGVELDKKKVEELRNKGYPDKVTIIESDYLEYVNRGAKNYQVILGNPPYISIKNMDKSFLNLGRSICEGFGLPKKLLQNSWVAFVLASIKIIEANGVIFFVLPTEFLQVQYAEILREFLENKFNTIHIITFTERMFPKIEQEACLVYLTNEQEELPYIAYKQYEKLDAIVPIYESRIERNKPLKKWSNAVLSDRDIDIMNNITDRYRSIGEMATSAPGIVTAANNKFILTNEEVEQYECRDYVIPIISKGMMVRNRLVANQELVNQLALDGKKVYMLNLAGIVEDELPESLKRYLDETGEVKRGEIKIKESFKCSRRTPWYAIPVVRSGSVIFFKRYDTCPRISINPDMIHTTDIAYNLQLNDDVEASSLVFCFYNSLSLAQCEFAGRYYAGGVSELTPTEFRSIAVPYRKISAEDVDILGRMFHDERPLDEIIRFVNKKTICQDLLEEEISVIDNIRRKLINRRK